MKPLSWVTGNQSHRQLFHFPFIEHLSMIIAVISDNLMLVIWVLGFTAVMISVTIYKAFRFTVQLFYLLGCAHCGLKLHTKCKLK